MRLATSSCNPLCQDRRNITDTFLRAAVPMRFVKAGCKAKWQERHTKSKNIRAASTVRTRPQIRGRSECYVFFFHFEIEIELSPQSRAHFADLIFQKCSERFDFLTFWSASRALATILCTFCRQLSQIEARTRKQRPPFGHHRSHFTRQKHKVSHLRVFSPVNSRVPELLHFLTMMVGWHDDVVDMMVEMLVHTIVRNVEVFELNFLWYT